MDQMAGPRRTFTVTIVAAAVVEGDGARRGAAVEAEQQRADTRVRQHGAPLEGVQRDGGGRQRRAAAEQAAAAHGRREQRAEQRVRGRRRWAARCVGRRAQILLACAATGGENV